MRPLSTFASTSAPSSAEPSESSLPGKETSFYIRGAEARRSPRVDDLDGRVSRVYPYVGL